MPSSRRFILYLLAAVAIVATARPLPRAAATKDYPLCVQGCNTARALCYDQCQDDCFALYPDSKQNRDDCIAACKAECSVQSEDCKKQCQADRDGESPPDP